MNLKPLKHGGLLVCVLGFATIVFILWRNASLHLNIKFVKQSHNSTNHGFRAPEAEDKMHQSEWERKQLLGSWKTDPDAQRYFLKTRTDRDWDWKQPINFWGVVLDERDLPVANAKVHLGWNDLSIEGSSRFETFTDSDGFFELRDRRGKLLTVSVEKEGYRRCRWGIIGFEYANPTDRAYHVPDPTRRVLFRLIKRGPREPMVQRERMEFQTSEDTGDLNVDLVGQRQVSSPSPNIDLQVHCEHGPVSDFEGRKRFDWKVTLRAPNGGIQQGSECPTEAPADGYLPEIQVDGTFDGPQSERGLSQQWFFLQTRGGRHYARVHLSVFPLPHRGGPSVVQIHEYVLNPSGSRNLEFYPEMQVAEKYYVPRDP